MDYRTPFEVTASIGFSIALASITVVPWVLTAGRGLPDDDAPLVYLGDDEDGVPEEDWDPIPASQPQVVVLASSPSQEPDAAEPAPSAMPSVEEVRPTVVSALPLVEGGVDVPIADPLAFLETGWGSEPDPTVEDPEDGAPEDVIDPDNDGLADASDRGVRRVVKRVRVKAVKPKTVKPKTPCTEDNPAIAEIVAPTVDVEGHWAVQRSLVEYYATHPMEFEAIATYVVTHKDAADEPDGFKVGLKRCSVLWETGFRSGDVVHAVNGRTISTVMQAIGAYFALRNEHEFDVDVTRKGGTNLVLHYTLVDDTREERHMMRDFLRAARALRDDEKQAAREKKREERAAR